MLDLSRTHHDILHAPDLAVPVLDPRDKLWGIMCMGTLTVGAHVKCKAYQEEWLKLSIAFKVGQNFISSY
jgi:hypothetical protein